VLAPVQREATRKMALCFAVLEGGESDDCWEGQIFSPFKTPRPRVRSGDGPPDKHGQHLN
jgi:hypothetical protein